MCALPHSTLPHKMASLETKSHQYPQTHHGHHQHLNLQSMVTVNPYDVSSHEGLIGGCDTDSSDSQYASVLNLPTSSRSPTPYRRPQQCYTTRLKPTQQLKGANLHSQELSVGHVANRSTYISPQLSRLTSTLRPYGYSAIDTSSYSSTNSSPHRTASSTNTVSTMQMGSPYHFSLNRYHLDRETNSAVSSLHQNPLNNSSLPSQEPFNQHVYCEIPLTTSSRIPPSNGSYDSMKWDGRQSKLSNWQSSKYCKETEEEDLFSYTEDTARVLQNVSDLSEDELLNHGALVSLVTHSGPENSKRSNQRTKVSSKYK